MQQDFCFYPFHPEVRKLPVHLTGIGSTDYQQPVSRPEGYFWHQFLLCTAGKGSLIHDGTERPFHSGDCVFLPAGIPHAYYPIGEKWGMQWFTFDGHTVVQLLEQFDMTKPVRLSNQSSALLQSLHARMKAALMSDRIYGVYTCSALVYRFLFEFHRLTLIRTDASNHLITGTLSYIDHHYHEDLSIQQLAQHAGVTSQHLCRVFREVIHMSPGQHITQRRIQAAQELILTTSLSFSEIAQQTGFTSPGYFSTVFRNCVGISPSEYRNEFNVNRRNE